MRILHFFKTYWPDSYGGIERVIHSLAKGCVEMGLEVDVLTLSATPAKEPRYIDGHRVIQAKRNLNLASTGFSWSAIGTYRQLAKEADIVHYHFPWPFMDLVDAITPHKKPTIVSYHSDIVKQKVLLRLYSPLMNHFFKSTRKIVAASPNYVETSNVLQRYKDKVTVIPYGLDQGDYPKPSEDRLRYWDTKFPDGFFLFVGVLRYYKGIHILLEAAKRCKLPIVVVGGGGEEENLKQAALQENVENFHLIGQQNDEDKIALLTLCTGFVFPSHLRSEAFGMSLVEAALHSKPMISCEIGTGTSFVNKHEETGLVVPPENPEALASAMMRLWKNDQERAFFGQAARARFNTHFTSRQMVDSYLQIYNSL